MVGLKKIDYCAKDFSSMMTEMITYVQNRLTDWTDFNESNVGRMLLELVAWLGDLLTYYLDKQANEAFLATAIRRSNLIHLCEMLAYRLSTATAASTTLRFVIAAPSSYYVIIPDATKCKTAGDQPVYFETVGNALIPPGELFVDVAAREGYTTTDIMAISDGTPSQKRIGRYNPFIQDTLLVYVNQVEWNEVDNFLDSTAADPHFITSIDDEEYISIEFGDGVNGAIPPLSADIRCLYRVGGGVRGRVEQNTINQCLDAIFDYAQNPINVAVTNIIAATGGTNKETIEHARAAAPKQVRVADRSIAKEDFEINAETVTGVCRILALSSNESTSVPENTVRVFVVPFGGGVPSQAMLDDVEVMLRETRPMWVTGLLEIWPAAYEDIDVTVDVYYRPSADETTVKAAIEAAIATFFMPGERDSDGEYYINFGRTVFLSDLYRLLDSVAGVDHVDIIAPAANATLAAWQFPQAGIITTTMYLAT